MTERRDFVQGMIAGLTGTLVGGIAIVYAMARADLLVLDEPLFSDTSAAGDWVSWAYTNLGSSIPVFAVLIIAFFITLGRLRKYLDQDRPVNQVVQLDHLADIWTTLFFGTGVIWTAIGMRSALIYALGDRDLAVSQGAFAMLERMIDGGILLALSTTIFGGVGGYLMRVYKTVALGAELQHCYDRAARADTSEMRECLHRIEAHLGQRKPSTDNTSTDDSEASA